MPFRALTGMAALFLTAAASFSAGTHERPVAPPDASAAVRLVRDLNPAAVPGNFQRTTELVPVGEVAYFLGGEGEWSDMEGGLWVTDGSASGTRLVRSFPSMDGSGGASGLVAAAGRLFFFAQDGGADRYVWTSDGTAEGTQPLVATGNSFLEPYILVPAGDRALFLRYPGSGIDVELWASDGTGEGTRMLRLFDDPESVYDVGGLSGWNGRLGFRGWDQAHGSELWVSDGTPEGTVLLKDATPGPVGSFPDTLTADGERLFFIAATGEYGSREIWISDGTGEGSRRIAGSPDFFEAYHLTPAGGFIYFRALTADNVRGLWRTDGTPGGTLFVAALDVLGWSVLAMADLSGGTVLFGASDGVAGYDLWRSDGTPEGTRLVLDITPGGYAGPYAFTSWTDRVYLIADGPTAGAELWRSDGTAQGTILVSDIRPGPEGSWPDSLQVWKGRLWLQADDGTHGLEPWTNDGTGEGTRLFAELAPDAASSSIHSLIQWGTGGALMESGNGLDPYQIWISDGSASGTQPVATFDPAVYWRPPGPLVSRGDLAFFSQFSTALGEEVWSTDGTPDGTRAVRDIIPGPTGSIDVLTVGTVMGGAYYFSGSDGVHGLEPWKTDGTAAGTRMLADLCTAPEGYNPTTSSWPDQFVADDGRLFFTGRGDNGDAGWYASDGTAAGTRLLADLGAQSDQITILPPAVSGGQAFMFTMEQESSHWDLWRSDGTPEGTESIAYLNASPGTADWWTPGPLFAFDGKVWFNAAPYEGGELWISDGSYGGTFLFKDIYPGEGSSNPADFAALGDRFYFRADDGIHGAELWTSDGTEAGTFMIKDLCPGLCSGHPMDLASSGTRLFFSATDGLHGLELWMTDGTTDGTRLAADIRPGPASSGPVSIIPSGAAVYFTADDGRTGRELWRFDPPIP